MRVAAGNVADWVWPHDGGIKAGTVDFTSHGTPVAVAAGNLWFVCSIGCNINVANCTNHKFPAATPTGVPSEVKSTVVKKILDKDGRPNPFRDNTPGYDWFTAFMKRHPELSIRKSESLPVSRA